MGVTQDIGADDILVSAYNISNLLKSVLPAGSQWVRLINFRAAAS